MASTLKPIDLPIDIQDIILNLTLTHRSKAQIHSFLKLYVNRYGLDNGHLLTLPYHPSYPFLTTIRLNPYKYPSFPKEAYLLLWYLVDVYTIGISFDKFTLSNYLYFCSLPYSKRKNKQLLTWMKLFRRLSWWKRQLKKSEYQKCDFLFVTFKCVRENRYLEDGFRILRKYQCEVQHGFDQADEEHNRIKFFMCRANGVDPNSIPRKIFSLPKWDDPESAHPQDFIRDIKDCLSDFYGQNEYLDEKNPDHPMHRVDGRRYTRPKKYVPGLKILVSDSSSSYDDSDESDSSASSF